MSKLAAQLGIRAMPTFLFFKNGEKIHEIVGANPPQLINFIATNSK
jgi:thioredoxin 1